MNKKGDLNQKQQAFIKRKQTALALINNSFPRPSKPLYKGKSNVLLGVAIQLEKPVICLQRHLKFHCTLQN